MQCFAIIVNFVFASGQFPVRRCQINYLISLLFSAAAEAGREL
jgi:hypothetical protein